VPEDWVAEICGGLNTSIGGQSDSLLHLQDALGWIKEELKGEQYFKSISWSESERGVYDVRDILDVLTCFNTTFYPNAGGTHPVAAYESRSVVLSSFEQDYRQNGGAAFRRLRPLLKQMLFLYDTIRIELPILLERGGKAPPDLIERAPKKPFEFPFLGTRATEQPARGAVLPILAAFRWMVEDDEGTKSTRWRGGFGNVLERWKKSCEALARHTTEKCRELDDGPDALGRSAAHWGALHKEVAFLDLMAKPTPPRSAAPPAARTGTGTA
jgi:hypothetical protein